MRVPLSCSLVDALTQLLEGRTGPTECSQNTTEHTYLPVRQDNTVSRVMSATRGQPYSLRRGRPGARGVVQQVGLR